MRQPTYDELKAAIEKFKYKWFTKPYDLNVVGIRNASRTPNAYDDTIAIAWVDNDGNKRVFCAPITTDPGMFYLQNPMNPAGCAILVPGQYLGSHKLGKHQGKYKALVQVKPMSVYRDNNRDKFIDAFKIQTGLFGINIHRSVEAGISRNVDKWSAGCQVFSHPHDFNYLIALVEQQKAMIGTDAVSYTLIMESNIT